MKIGLQLYSVREDMENDFEATLRAVKEMGYDYVEFAGYFDRTPEEVRALLDEIGLRCESVHQGYSVYLEDFDKYVNLLKTIGATYTAIPSIGEDCHLGGENCEKTLEEITELGEKLRAEGITQLYHNHEFEFKTYEGKVKLDYFYEKIPAECLGTELDVCWVTYGGGDPAAEIRKYADRTNIIHLKDFNADKLAAGPAYELIGDDGKIKTKSCTEVRDESGFKFAYLGSGRVDFDAIFEAAEEVGAETFIVEQDMPTEGLTALECARRSREFLRSKGY